MIQLDTKNYDKVVAPLQSVTINTLFAQSVVLQEMPGLIYVDNIDEPTTFYISHSYGMSLLFGNSENESFNNELFSYLTNENIVRDKMEWLQVFPDQWSIKIESILGSYLIKNCSTADNSPAQIDEISNKVVENTRVNFVFNEREYLKAKVKYNVQEFEIIQATGEIFENMNGSVVPKYFWRDSDHFQNTGLGYSLIYEGEIASTAFSAFRTAKQLEIGIETLDKHRGKNFAFMVCSALIDFCLENGLEPVWACRKENSGSYFLAKKLGFVHSLSIPYYKLVL